MADQQNPEGPVSAEAPSAPNIYETRQDELVFHRIYDGDLDRLTRIGERDYWSEALWAMIGIAAGVTPSAIEGLVNAYVIEKAVPLSVFGLAHVVLLGIAICVGFVVLRAKKKGDKDSGAKLAEEIRNRKRYEVK